jgi:hypothetical protein
LCPWAEEVATRGNIQRKDMNVQMLLESLLVQISCVRLEKKILQEMELLTSGVAN